MDNYSKNKINIPGFIIFILWSITVVAVANHNYSFVNKSSNKSIEKNRNIDIANTVEVPTTLKFDNKAPRFSFNDDIDIIASSDPSVFPLKEHGDHLYNYKNKKLTVYNTALENIKNYEFKSIILGVIDTVPNLIFVFTKNSFMYALSQNDKDNTLQRITKLPYSVEETYNLKNNSFILTKDLNLKHFNPVTLEQNWGIQLDDKPSLLVLKEDKLLIFSKQNQILILEANTGKNLFKINYPYEAKDAISVDVNNIIIKNSNDSIVNVNIETKEISWDSSFTKITNFFLLPEHKTLFIIEENSKLIALNPENGNSIWNRNLEHKSYNFIFPIKVTAKEIQSFDLGWKYKGEIFMSSCSKTSLCFIDPKNGRVLKITRSFPGYELQSFKHKPFWLNNRLSLISLGEKTKSE